MTTVKPLLTDPILETPLAPEQRHTPREKLALPTRRKRGFLMRSTSIFIGDHEFPPNAAILPVPGPLPALANSSRMCNYS